MNKIYIAQTKVLKSNRGSGDIVTTLLVYAMTKGIINKALVSKMKGSEAEAFIAKTDYDIISARGSKYCFIPQEHLYDELDKNSAAVGLPCQTAKMPKDVLKIGLFCGLNYSKLALDYVLKKYKINKDEIEDLDHRTPNKKGLYIRLKNGKEYNISRCWWLSFFFSYPMCINCTDYLNHSADIAVGDAKKDWSIVIVRTERGNELFNKAVFDDQINAKEITKKEMMKYRKSPMKQKEFRGGFKNTWFVRVRSKSLFKIPFFVLKWIGKIYAWWIK